MVKKYPIKNYFIYAFVNFIGLLFSTYAFSTPEVTVSKTASSSVIEVVGNIVGDFDPYYCSLTAKLLSPSGKIPTTEVQLFFYSKNTFSGELNTSELNLTAFTDTEIQLSAFSEESSCKPNLDAAHSLNGINLIFDGVKISGVKLLPNIPTLNIFLDLNSHAPVQNILLNKPSASEIKWSEPATKSFVLETVLPQISRQLEFIEEKDITLFFHSETGIASETFKREDLQNDMAFARSILRITDQNSLAFEDKDYSIFSDTNWRLFSSISEPVIISDLRSDLFCEIFATVPDASIIRLGTSSTTSCTSISKAYPTIDLIKLITKSPTEQKYLISSSLFQKETANTVGKLNPLKADIQSSGTELDETKIALAASLARQQRLELELSDLNQNINEKTAAAEDYSEKLSIAEGDLASALLTLEQQKINYQTLEDKSNQDIKDLRSKLADALAARWQATQLSKEALDNLKDNLKFEGDPDITDLRSKLADALAARWAAVQSQKEALENLKMFSQLSLFLKN